jgi:hypothetical protein
MFMPVNLKCAHQVRPPHEHFEKDLDATGAQMRDQVDFPQGLLSRDVGIY